MESSLDLTFARELCTREHADVVIKCGSQRFPVHSFMLCAQSDFFKAALSGPWKVINIENQMVFCLITYQENLTREYNFEGDADLMRRFIDLVYGRKWPTDSNIEIATKLYELAGYFQSPIVRLKCEEYLETEVEIRWEADYFITMIERIYSGTEDIAPLIKSTYMAVLKKKIMSLVKSERIRNIVICDRELSKTLIDRMCGMDDQH